MGAGALSPISHYNRGVYHGEFSGEIGKVLHFFGEKTLFCFQAHAEEWSPSSNFCSTNKDQDA